MQNLWHVCLRRLEQELPQQQYSTWVRPLAVDAGSAGTGTLVLSAPNRFILEHVRGTLLARIARIVSEEAGSEIDVRIVLARQTAPTDGLRPTAPTSPQIPKGAPAVAPDRARLNRNFSFDTLVTGKANQLARAAAMQVAENPGISYNPLFI